MEQYALLKNINTSKALEEGSEKKNRVSSNKNSKFLSLINELKKYEYMSRVGNISSKAENFQNILNTLNVPILGAAIYLYSMYEGDFYNQSKEVINRETNVCLRIISITLGDEEITKKYHNLQLAIMSYYTKVVLSR